MSNIAIRVENLSKRYRIGQYVGSGAHGAQYKTLRESLTNAVTAPLRRLRRNPQSAIRNPQSNRFIWALRDVSFEVKQGEVLGIIGRNGAGKSTLLKVLTRITEPTKGWAEMKGRVGSLLEVGTGFHPELTGRENIYLSGTILGMRRKEVDRKFDEIVDFSGVETYIDTPVKRYSSGMRVRLGFAVAAHLEPEILLIDEVLAVGDAAFQKKCLGKMGDVAKEGRTVLFVSHNMQAISMLCPKAMLLNEGRITVLGDARVVVAEYLRSVSENSAEVCWSFAEAPGNSTVKLRAVRVRNTQDDVCSRFGIDSPIILEMDFWCIRSGTEITPAFHVYTDQGIPLLATGNMHDPVWGNRKYDEGLYRTSCTIPANFLNKGRYYVTMYLSRDVSSVEVNLRDVVSFEVVDTGEGADRGDFTGEWIGLLRVLLPWTTSKIGDVG